MARGKSSNKAKRLEPIEGPIPVTLITAAEIAKVTEKTLRTWIAAGMRVLQEGAQGRGKKTIVDLRDVLRTATEQDALDIARTRRESAQADKIEMENAERRRDLARISTMTQAFADAVVTAQALLLAIPTKEARSLAALNDANAIEHRLRTAIGDALRQLAAYGKRGEEKRAGRGRSRNGSVRTASSADGESMGGGEQGTH